MEHDCDWLAQVLTDLGYIVHRTPHSAECVVDCQLGDFDVQVKVVLTDDFPSALPKFHLLERFKYGALAHIAWGESGYADICFGSPSAFHVDYEYPERIVEATLGRALDILSKALNDKEYNEAELKREFVGVWRFNVDAGSPWLFCMAEPPEFFEALEVRSNDSKANDGVGKGYVALAKEHALNDKHSWVRSAASSGRSNQGKGVLINIPNLLIPPSPGETVHDWWSRLLLAQPDSLLNKLKDYARHNRAKEFFIACRALTDAGAIWFGLYGKRTEKDRVPLHPDYLENWQINAISLNVAARENLLPRGGASLNLCDAKVCLVGCGSVGGYIADLLASSGVGHIDLVDHDWYMFENSYRHYLCPYFLHSNKAQALKSVLEYKYPFVTCDYLEGKLQALMPELQSKKYDLIICATGDQSQERYFNQFIHQEEICVPVVYAWVEAYGVGGHALASLPSSKGCLNCLFYDKETEEKSLYPSIGFIEKEQDIVSSHAGCGQEYISYSNIDATQTASIAARLATRVLNSELSESVLVSWRGNNRLAEEHGVKLTHRYHRLTHVLEEIPIAFHACAVCSSNEVEN